MVLLESFAERVTTTISSADYEASQQANSKLAEKIRWLQTPAVAL